MAAPYREDMALPPSPTAMTDDGASPYDGAEPFPTATTDDGAAPTATPDGAAIPHRDDLRRCRPPWRCRRVDATKVSGHSQRGYQRANVGVHLAEAPMAKKRLRHGRGRRCSKILERQRRCIF
ncbi:hypothetical protein TRIUR3_16025 [Triticum urartu]|uniref:Uncharacterized protein n=1 Tax=Triticum urartu TaxID=4572 RepID=M7ZQT0_TRIUA|nr:hypothetical protein TRIUR3_16025 [Triticum urartu]